MVWVDNFLKCYEPSKIYIVNNNSVWIISTTFSRYSLWMDYGKRDLIYMCNDNSKSLILLGNVRSYSSLFIVFKIFYLLASAQHIVWLSLAKINIKVFRIERRRRIKWNNYIVKQILEVYVTCQSLRYFGSSHSIILQYRSFSPTRL